ncbi:hypothetical protein M422DRAFT_53907 [Sphaerobolus stellatus SS14]|uniref:Uncharacterized protein n=1 Tax=Sphaerobolus stellatus (strain SS14) TaxID=990650 RepID=A0A0C9UXH1_SPHS4|nr:hypothetical protein M422DRAFT_53907 [Sphaerobolus stellatus SS14]
MAKNIRPSRSTTYYGSVHKYRKTALLQYPVVHQLKKMSRHFKRVLYPFRLSRLAVDLCLIPLSHGYTNKVYEYQARIHNAMALRRLYLFSMADTGTLAVVLWLGYLSCRNMDVSLRTNTVTAMINIISIYTKIWKPENSLSFKLSAPCPEEQLVYEAFNVLGGMLPSIRYTLPGVGTDSLPTNIEDELYQLYQNILKNRYFEPDDSRLDMGLDLHRKMFKLLSQHGISCLNPDKRLKGFDKEILEEVEEALLLCGAGVRGSSLRAGE